MTFYRYFLLVFSFCFSICFPALNQWSMPYSVGNGNYFDLALNSDGSKAICVFSSLTNSKVSSGYSTDQGQTWLLNSDFADGLGASVAVSSNGDIAYGAWYDLTNHVIAAYSTDHGMTWINQSGN